MSDKVKYILKCGCKRMMIFVWGKEKVYLLEKNMATHSSILAWKIPSTEKPGKLQSMGCKELDMTEHKAHTHILSSFINF